MTLLLLVRSASGGGGGDSIVVDEPLADARLLVGETVEIHVSVTPGVSGLFDVLLSLDGGSTFPITLQSDEPEINLGWTINSDHIAARAVIRVRDAADALIFGDSDEFVVATTTPITGGSDAPLCLVTFPVRDQYGAALDGEPVEIRFNEFATGATADALVLSTPPTQTSASGSVVVNLFRLASYSVFYGNAAYQRRYEFTTPDASTYTVGE